MHAPSLIGWLLVVLGTSTGMICLMRSRIPGGEACARRTARAEGVMGFGMAMMALPDRPSGEGVWCASLLAATFAALAVRTGAFAYGESHRTHHTLEAAAMVYMAAVSITARGTNAGPMAAMSHSAMGVPAVNAALMAYFALYVLLAGPRLLTGSVSSDGPPGMWQAPEVGHACRVSLATCMLVMAALM